MISTRVTAGVIVVAALTTSATSVFIDPYYADSYVHVELGQVPGLPVFYGGVTFRFDDPDTLLIASGVISSDRAIYAIEVVRDCNDHVIGFKGEATHFADAPHIEAGLEYGPGNVLFYTTSTNMIGQIKPGSTKADRIIDLTPLGVSPSTGGLVFVPSAFAGAGSLKITSFDTDGWYDSTIVPDGDGTFDIIDVTFISTLGNGPQGFGYVGDQNVLFDADSVLIGESVDNRFSAYEIEGDGNPIVDTRRTFVGGLGNVDGATIDPVAGDLIIVGVSIGGFLDAVHGFVVPCAGDLEPPGGDGIVGFTDLLAILSGWGGTCVPADIDESGEVGLSDLLVVLSQWGPCE